MTVARAHIRRGPVVVIVAGGPAGRRRHGAVACIVITDACLIALGHARTGDAQAQVLALADVVFDTNVIDCRGIAVIADGAVRQRLTGGALAIGAGGKAEAGAGTGADDVKLNTEIDTATVARGVALVKVGAGIVIIAWCT